MSKFFCSRKIYCKVCYDYLYFIALSKGDKILKNLWVGDNYGNVEKFK